MGGGYGTGRNGQRVHPGSRRRSRDALLRFCAAFLNNAGRYSDLLNNGRAGLTGAGLIYM